jgi:hypothetical protein
MSISHCQGVPEYKGHTAADVSSMRGVWCISEICSLVQSLRGAVAFMALWKTEMFFAAAGDTGG